MPCLYLGSKLAMENDGVIDRSKLTGMERQAIKDARHAFAAALAELGLMPHFESLSADAIDTLINAAVAGFQGSMWRQSASGEIPF
jgi:hypothetical protein